jgi:hypothetical protein
MVERKRVCKPRTGAVVFELRKAKRQADDILLILRS